MNIENDKSPNNPAKRPSLNFDEKSRDPRDDLLASLEERNASLQDRILEERFLWILMITILFDAYIFSNMSNWAGAFVVGIFELIGIVIIAERCKVNIVMPLIDRIAGMVSNGSNNGNNQ